MIKIVKFSLSCPSAKTPSKTAYESLNQGYDSNSSASRTRNKSNINENQSIGKENAVVTNLANEWTVRVKKPNNEKDNRNIIRSNKNKLQYNGVDVKEPHDEKQESLFDHWDNQTNESDYIFVLSPFNLKTVKQLKQPPHCYHY